MRRIRSTLGAAVLLVLVCAFNPTARAQTREVAPVERVAAITRPATVYMEISVKGALRDERDGKLWIDDVYETGGTCSGSVISPDGYVLSAGHCVDNTATPNTSGFYLDFAQAVADLYVERGHVAEKDADAFLETVYENSVLEGPNGGDADVEVTVYRGVIKPGTDGDFKTYKAEVIDFQPRPEGDIALLKIDGSGLPSTLISDEVEVGVGTPVVAIGYPGSVSKIIDPTLEPATKDGTISAARTEKGVPFYEVNAAVSQGMSGGPVVDLRGEVVGVVSHGPAEEKQAFNFVAGASSVRDVLSEHDVVNKLAPVDVVYRRGLQHLFAGEFSAGIAAFDDVLRQQADHAQAKDLKARAEKLRERYGDKGGSSFLVPALIGALLLLAFAGVLTIWMLKRRRRQAPGVDGPAGTTGMPGHLPPSQPQQYVAPQPAPQQPPPAEPGGTRCTNCGGIEPAGFMFCTSCGSRLPA